MALYAFDGTWNRADAEHVTNVKKFHDLYQGPTNQYESGVGTRLGAFGLALGGAFGFGGFSRVGRMYDALCRNWMNGDRTIDVIGFSRGAALALDFVAVLAKRGIRRPGSKEIVEARPKVRFLGLWDIVQAFGLAYNIGPLKFRDWNIGHASRLPAGTVETCVHAMALDERRHTYMVLRLDDAYEVWFRGVHSDVGGGNGNIERNNIALRWMLYKAAASGLPGFQDEARILSATTPFDSNAPVSPGAKWDLIKNDFRPTRPSDRCHYTVMPKPGFNNPLPMMALETPAVERLASGGVPV